MSRFITVRGNYIEVADTFGLSGFYATQTPEDYCKQIALDVPRTAYLSYEKTVEEMKKYFLDRSHLADNELTYTQANFDGAVFNHTLLTSSDKYSNAVHLASQEGTEKSVFGSLRIAYTDDEGQYCGLAISYVRDDQDPDKLQPGEEILPVEKRKRRFAVTVIKNTNLTPTKREVTYIADPIFQKSTALAALQLDKKHVKPLTEIDIAEVPEIINRLINSKNLSILLQGLFNGDTLAVDKFEELSARIKINRNIDNRDVKLEQLKKIELLIETIPNNRSLRELLKDLIAKATSDLNFFKSGIFEVTLEEIYTQINEHLRQEPLDEATKNVNFLNNKILYLSLRMELKSFDLNNSTDEDSIRFSVYQEKSKNLYSLLDNDSNQKAPFLNATLEELTLEAEIKAVKLYSLHVFIKEKLITCDNEKAPLAQLKEIEEEVIKGFDSYDVNALNIRLGQLGEQFDAYLATYNSKLAIVISDKLKKFSHAIQASAEKLSINIPDFIRNDLISKAKELHNLAGSQLTDAMRAKAKKYIEKDFSLIVQECITKSIDRELELQRRKLRKEINTEVSKLTANNTSFFQRNIGAILSGSVAILIGTALTVFIALTIPPFAILTGILTTLAVLAAVEVIQKHEKKHSEAMRKYSKEFFQDDAEAALEETINLRLTEYEDSLNLVKCEAIDSILTQGDSIFEHAATPRTEIETEIDTLLDKADALLTESNEMVEKGKKVQVEVDYVPNDTSLDTQLTNDLNARPNARSFVISKI